MHRNTHELAAQHQPPGEVEIVAARLEIARGVVVEDQYAGRAVEQREAEKLGIEGLKWLDADAVQSEVHSPTYLGARWEEQAALINPAKYVRGLKRVAQELEQ